MPAPPAASTGTDPEPRPGRRSGHIPGSYNLPFNELLDPKSEDLSVARIRSPRTSAGPAST